MRPPGRTTRRSSAMAWPRSRKLRTQNAEKAASKTAVPGRATPARPQPARPLSPRVAFAARAPACCARSPRRRPAPPGACARSRWRRRGCPRPDRARTAKGQARPSQIANRFAPPQHVHTRRHHPVGAVVATGDAIEHPADVGSRGGRDITPPGRRKAGTARSRHPGRATPAERQARRPPRRQRQGHADGRVPRRQRHAPDAKMACASSAGMPCSPRASRMRVRKSGSASQASKTGKVSLPSCKSRPPDLPVVLSSVAQSRMSSTI
jgi:hypothetical protein